MEATSFIRALQPHPQRESGLKSKKVEDKRMRLQGLLSVWGRVEPTDRLLRPRHFTGRLKGQNFKLVAERKS